RAATRHVDDHAARQLSGTRRWSDLATPPTAGGGRERSATVRGGRGAAEGAGGAGGAGGPDGAGEMTIARIDFAGVGCIDYSCADEIVAKLLRDRPAVLVLSEIGRAHV